MSNLCFKNKTKINHFIIEQKYICGKRNIFFVLKHRLKSFYIFFQKILESQSQISTKEWHPLSKAAIMIYKSKIIGFLSGFESGDVIRRRNIFKIVS